MEWTKKFYDADRKRFKSRYLPLFSFLVGMIVTFLVSIAIDSALIFTVSCTLLVIGAIALVHHDWVFNSLVIPMAPTLLLVVLQDVYTGSFLALLLHSIILVFCIVPMFRKNTSFFTMMLSLCLFIGLIVSIKNWSGVYYYDNLFGIPMSVEAQSMLMLSLGSVVAVLISIKNWLIARKSNVPIDCDGGICPL